MLQSRLRRQLPGRSLSCSSACLTSRYSCVFARAFPNALMKSPTYQNCHPCLQAYTGPHVTARCCVQAAIDAEQGLLAAANARGKCDEGSLADHVLADLLAASAEGRLPGCLYGEHTYIYRVKCSPAF